MECQVLFSLKNTGKKKIKLTSGAVMISVLKIKFCLFSRVKTGEPQRDILLEEAKEKAMRTLMRNFLMTTTTYLDLRVNEGLLLKKEKRRENSQVKMRTVKMIIKQNLGVEAVLRSQRNQKISQNQKKVIENGRL